MSPRPGQPLRIAVVDDSSFIRRALARVLAEEPRIEVVGTAASGEALLANFEAWCPDVVTLDLEMPGMGGLATLDHIRERAPAVAVIILSTHSGAGAPQTIEALHRGAVDFIDKQRYSLVDFSSLRAVLTDTVFKVFNIESEVPEVVVSPREKEESSTEIPNLAGWLDHLAQPSPSSRYAMVAIGASTGGPPALQHLLEDIGCNIPAPVLVVQHMPIGFTDAFAERLNAHLPIEVREAESGERPVPGTVLIAPGGSHLRVRQDQEGLRVHLAQRPCDAPHTPSVDVLFRSVARSLGRRAIGVLLTGMGTDGARGMARLCDMGARTLVQDESSSVVYGMPRAALALDVVDEVVPIASMGERLRQLLTEPDATTAAKSSQWNRRENM